MQREQLTDPLRRVAVQRLWQEAVVEDTACGPDGSKPKPPTDELGFTLLPD